MADQPKLYDKLFPVIDPKYRIVSDVLYYPSFDFKNNLLYCFQRCNNPGIYSYDLSVKTKNIIIKVDDICDLLFSPDFSKAIANVSYDGERFKKYGSSFSTRGIKDGEMTYWLIDFGRNKVSLLDRSIQSFYWKSNQELIIHYHNWNVEPNINFIGILHLPNGSIERLIDRAFYEVKFFGLHRDNLYFMEQPTEFAPTNQIFEYSLVSKKIGFFTDRSDIYDIQFSPSNNQCLVISLDKNFRNSFARIFDMSKKQFVWQLKKDWVWNNCHVWSNNETATIVSRGIANRYYLDRYNLVNHNLTTKNKKLDIKPQVDVQSVWANNNNLFILANNFMYQMQL